MNLATIIGRSVRDAELRYTAAGHPVMSLTVVTNEPRGGGENRKMVPEFHKITVYGKFVETLSPKIKKGTELFVMGPVRTREWTDKQGAKRSSTEIEAKTIRITQEKFTEADPTDAELQRNHAADEKEWNV